jgi:hypothetical protein
MTLSPETPLTLTLPAGVWPLLRAGLDHVPVARAVTDAAIAALEQAHAQAVAGLPQDDAQPGTPEPAPAAKLRRPKK